MDSPTIATDVYPMLLFSILTETTPDNDQNYHLTQIEEINEVFRNEKITPKIVKLYLDGIEMIRKEYVYLFM